LAMQKDLDVLSVVLDSIKLVQKKPRH